MTRAAWIAIEAGLTTVLEGVRELLAQIPAPAPEPPSEPTPEPPAPAPPPPLAPLIGWHDRSVTWTHYNRTGGLMWRNPGGDWLDADGVQQGGTPLATLPVSKAGVWAEVDVTDIVRRWLSAGNDGLYVHGRASRANYATRESADETLRPHLIVTTDAGDVVCPCAGDVRMHSSVTGSLGDATVAQFGQGMLRFDLSAVSGDVVRATLRLHPLRVYTAGDAHIYLIDVPRPFDHGQAPRLGLAAETDDLAAHPDVLVAFDFAPGWREAKHWDRGRVSEHVPGEPVQIDGAWWLPVTMPVDDTCSGGGEGTGFSAGVLVHAVPDSINPVPTEPMGPLHLFGRYSIRLGEDWTSADDRQMTGGKFPGFAGRFGYLSRYGGYTYWQSTMDGGTPSKGKYFPTLSASKPFGHFSGWSARMQWYAQAQGQHDDPMRDATPIGSYLYYPEWQQAGTGLPVPWRNAQLVAGREYDIEQEVAMNSIAGPFDEYGNGVGQPDGVLRAWVDGVLVYERTDVIWRHHPAIGIEEFWMTFKNGGTLSPCLPHHLHVGPVVIAKRYIGPRPKRI